jgi:hypothetical protein
MLVWLTLDSGAQIDGFISHGRHRGQNSLGRATCAVSSRLCES